MAKFVEWSQDLSVGLEEIDAQHKLLIDLINDMHDAISQQKGTDAVAGILTQLFDYTRIHFAVEESLMRIFGYPAYQEHKLQHDQLIRKLRKLQEKADSSTAPVAFELMHLLKIWLTKHIMDTDKKYEAYFLQAGASPRLKSKSWISRMWDHLSD